MKQYMKQDVNRLLKFNMRNSVRGLVIVGAFLGMGFTLPSCPGQKAMQDQIDSMQATHADLNKKIQALTAQVTALNNDMTQAKQLLPQITNVIQAQKGALDQLEASIKELQAAEAKRNKQTKIKKKGR